MDCFADVEKLICTLNSRAGGLSCYQELESKVQDATVERLIEIHEQLTFPVWRRNVLLFAIQKLLQSGKIEESKLLISRFPPEFLHEGHRLFLKHFAERGEVGLFLAELKNVSARKSPRPVLEAKFLLIRTVSKIQSFEAALALLDIKAFQAKEVAPYVRSAIEGRLGLDPVTLIMERAQRLLVGWEENANQIQLAALVDALTKGEEITGYVNLMLAWIKAIDPQLRWGKFGMRSLCWSQLAARLIDLKQKELAAKVIQDMPSDQKKADLQKELRISPDKKHGKLRSNWLLSSVVLASILNISVLAG